MRALFVIASLWLGAVPAVARDDRAGIEAIWLRQVVSFVYRADNTVYSCSSLWQKVAGMLVYVGARTIAPFERVKCDDFAGTVRLQITLESPVEATWDYPESKVRTEELIRRERGTIPAVLLRIAGVYTDRGDSIPLAHQIQRIYEKQLTGHVYRPIQETSDQRLKAWSGPRHLCPVRRPEGRA